MIHRHQTLTLLMSVLAIQGCVPRIEIAPPKEPVRIDMNVKIEHQIDVKMDKELHALLQKEDVKSETKM